MDSVLLWTGIVFAAAFIVVFGLEGLLAAGGDEDGWWHTREAWQQAAIAAGAVAGLVFLVWMVLRGVGL